jgi:hypothetical protein
MTNTPIAPAIGNALYDAIGVRFYDLPLTQEKILRALKNKMSEAQPDERVYAATSGEKSL